MGNRRMILPRLKKITLAKQLVNLTASYPDSQGWIRYRKQLTWWGKIRPSPLSQMYTVNLTYELGQPPEIWVIGDELERLNDPDFPHKYEVDAEGKKVRLCLYRYREFDAYKLLSDTIVPWVVEWLYHYEIWLATGEWCGGGEHPLMGNEKIEDAV